MSLSPFIARGAVYRFDRFELSTETGQLRKRGVDLRLAPQPFRLLLLLVSRAGRIVTREEIQAELWGSATFVDFEQGINAAIRRIRSALNDHAETPRFLQTLPRRGYCFVAPVERVDATDAVEAAPGEPAISLHTIVEPFMENEELPIEVPESSIGRRISVALIAVLVVMPATLFVTRGAHHVPAAASQVKPLRVSLSPAAFGGPDLERDARAFSVELHKRLAPLQPERIVIAETGAPSDLRIDATLRDATDGRHFDVQLMDGSSGKQLWRESVRQPGETNELPFEAAVRVSRAVAENLPPLQHGLPVRSQVSPRALALYREGLEVRTRPVPQRDLDRAVELLESALTLEPRFAEAWSAIGDIWTERTGLWMGESRRTAMTQARIALDRALAIDPNYPEALNDQGLLLMRFDRTYPEAEAVIRKAIAADPAYIDAHLNLAVLLSATGRHAEAKSEMRRAQILDPGSHVPSRMLATFHLMARRYDEARAEYRAYLVISRNATVAHWGLLSCAIASRNWKDAAESLSVLLGERVEIPAGAADPGAVVRRQLRRLEPMTLAKERGYQLDPYHVAVFHAEAGDPDRAFAALDRAIASQSTNSLLAFVDPRLDFIRNDPRFIDRLDQLRFIK